jgi:hypothetical protein
VFGITHVRLVRLPFRSFVTTNYDPCLEHGLCAYAAQEGKSSEAMSTLYHLLDHASSLDSLFYGVFVGLAIAGGFCLFREGRERFPRISTWAVLLLGFLLLALVTDLTGRSWIAAN